MKHSESDLHILDLRMNSLSLDAESTKTNPCGNYQISTLILQDHAYYRNSLCDMNASDREKMAQWEYRIVDYFEASRDLVGIAFSFLDRFTAKCTCDRQAYKLAAITSLFIAMKLHVPRRFSIDTLAALSRGEFEDSQIAQMELIMLKTLDWRLSPPTTQSFIHRWASYIFEVGCGIESIERAIFLAEIAVFDTILASKERALVAIAALFEGLSHCKFNQEENVLQMMKSDLGVSYTLEETKTIRNRLRYVYSKTSQYLAECSSHSQPVVLDKTKIEKDPVIRNCSVNMMEMKYRQSPISVRARCEQGHSSWN